MKYINKSLKLYLRDVASVLPAPGGGSVSALTAGLGVSLLLMAANFSSKRFAEKKRLQRLKGLIKELSENKKELEALIDDDVQVFRRLRAGMALPKNSASRDAVLQKSLADAATVPLKICETINVVIEHAYCLSENGNAHLMTDVGCAAVLLEAGFYSARYNVLVNLRYIRDKRFVKKTGTRVSAMAGCIVRAKAKILKNVDRYI